MTPSFSERTIAAAFERKLIHISFENIAPLYLVTPLDKGDGQIRPNRREQLDLMENESANLEREVRLVENSYGIDHLDLVLARVMSPDW